MGLFSKKAKIPPEQKNYLDAFAKAFAKPDEEKTFAPLREACKAFPVGWEAWLFMGLSYDLAIGVPFNPEKAAECHYQAKQAGKRDGYGWVDTFYSYYDECALNFRLEEDYFPRALNVRRLGAAIVNTFSPDEDHIGAHGFHHDDMGFWNYLLLDIDTGGVFKSTPEQKQVYFQLEPFRTYLDDYKYFKGAPDENGIIKRTNQLIKRCQRLNQIQGREMTIDQVDGWYLVQATALLRGGDPYLYGGEGWHQNSRIDGWRYFWNGSFRGSTSCLHVLGMFFDDEDFAEEIIYAGTLVISGVNTAVEVRRNFLALLELAADRGDDEAIRIISRMADKRS